MWSAPWLLSRLPGLLALALPAAAQAPGAALAPLPPPLAMSERLRYRVDFGPLEVGEIQLLTGSVTGGGQPVVRAGGFGQGSLLGFGHVENGIGAEFDAQRLLSRRWTNARRDDDGAGPIRDVAEQPSPGDVQMVRERSGAPAQRRRVIWSVPALDPLGFLLRVRVAPPPPGSLPQVLQVLDGQALWRVTLVNAGRQVLPDGRTTALRIEGHAQPISYGGAPDESGERRPRDIVLWLSEDPARVPLRLEVPLGIGRLVAVLVDAARLPRN